MNRKPNFSSRNNICWDCENACGGCVWSEIDPDTKRPRFEPVPGWTAEEVTINMGKGRQNVKGYHITACPQFVMDKRTTSAKFDKQELTPEQNERFLESMRFLSRRLKKVGGNQMD